MKFHLSINMAMTLDGKVSRPDGKWYGLCSATDRKQMDVLRAEAEVLIVGKNSIINDNPVIRLRFVDGKNPRPVMMIQNGIVPKNRHIFLEPTSKENLPLIFCTDKNINQMKEELNESAEIVSLGKEQINPVEVCRALEKLGYNKILLEGGPRLNHSFISADLVHRLNITLVPFLIGQNNLPAIVEGETPFPFFAEHSWKLVSCRKEENEVFLVYDKV